jgi:IS5 family transposase
VPLSLSGNVRWIMRRIKRSDRRREHEIMRKHGVRRKRMSEVVRKRSGRQSGHVLLMID